MTGTAAIAHYESENYKKYAGQRVRRRKQKKENECGGL
jgi:hypothetical protein